MYIEIKGKKIGPYEGIMKSDGSIKGDILPIIYDNAIIELYKSKDFRFSLGYKKSSSLFGNEIKYADIINENSGETFSFQVKNIFLAKIYNGDLKILAQVGGELKLYEKFGKTDLKIAIDYDKAKITPLGYYDMFLTYDKTYYYPLILNEKINENNIDIKKFYDIYGYKSYEDENGNEHLLMLIEHETSTKEKRVWYFIDNFKIISNRVDFGNEEEEVESWDINEDGDILIKTTMKKNWFIAKNSPLILEGVINNKKNIFNYTRHFEDTDSNFIVGKNSNGLFIIDRTKENINLKKTKELIYFKNFILSTNYNNYTFFLVENFDGEIVLFNENSYKVLTTDLDKDDGIIDLFFESEKIFVVKLKDGEIRKYSL